MWAPSAMSIMAWKEWGQGSEVMACVSNWEGGRNECWRSAHAAFFLSLGPQPDTAVLQVGLPISFNLSETIPHRYEQNYLPLVNPSCWQPRFTITFRRRPEQHHLQKSQEGACKETKKMEAFQKRCKEKRQTPTPAGGMERRLPRGVSKKARGSRLEPVPTLTQQSECMWGKSFWCPQTRFFYRMGILFFYRSLLRQLWIQASAGSLLFLALNRKVFRRCTLNILSLL